MPVLDDKSIGSAMDTRVTRKNLATALVLHALVIGGLLGSAYIFHNTEREVG